jgi:one cut domain, family member 1 (hepatocyte nuclear factor 6)
MLTLEISSFQQSLNQNENNGNSNNSNAKSGKVSASSAASLSLTSDVEEINTKELAQRISAELKRYSIPQAIFAQRVLCRSQVTFLVFLTYSELHVLYFV